ncbi:MAG: Fic family protein, partial [Woeseiaceae bacterium]
MTSPDTLLETIRDAGRSLSLRELLELHPELARRTMQRWMSQLVAEGKLLTEGKRRARRYQAAPEISVREPTTREDRFPSHIPLSQDSIDILAYVDRPLEARKPIGYRRDFLDAYRPNRTWYLPEPLRRQLRRMGDTGQGGLPAGTYGRAILNRLLIDLSWASSHLEGNTYTRLDTRELIEQGKIAQSKAAAETQMILNHKSAIELLVENAEIAGFNRYTILNLHSALSENLLPNPADEGRIRQHTVEIGKSVYRPFSVPAQISELLDVLLEKASRVEDPFEQSFFMMVHLPY